MAKPKAPKSPTSGGRGIGGQVPGQPSGMPQGRIADPMSVVHGTTLGAQKESQRAAKATSVSTTARKGTPVNPGHTSGGDIHDGIWQGVTEWAAESGTHA